MKKQTKEGGADTDRLDIASRQNTPEAAYTSHFQRSSGDQSPSLDVVVCR